MKNKKTGIFTHTVNIIKDKDNYLTLLIVFFTALIIYTFLYGLWTIPIIGFGFNRMSEVKVTDYIYILAASLMVALLITLIKFERSQKIKSGTAFTTTSSTMAGIISAICPSCQGITILALGSTVFNIPTRPLIPYIGIMQLAAVGLLALALYLKIDSTYTNTCPTCRIVKKIKKK